MKYSEKRRYSYDDAENDGGKPRAAYHKYFEGYTEVKAPKKNGHGEKIIRRYTAPWKQPSLDRKVWIKKKILAAGVYITDVVLSLFAIFFGASSHDANYIALFEMLLMVSLIVFLMALITYISSGYQMTLWEYKSGSESLVRYGKAVVVFAVLTGIAILLHTAIAAHTGIIYNLISAAAVLLGGGLMAILIYDENKIEYINVPNDTKKPDKGTEIWME